MAITNKMNVEDYLRRIGFEGEAKADLATLEQLQYRHFLTVPYENLDILRNVPLSLEVEDIYHKIVVQGRGGYCFELNALFNWLLCEIGFKTKSYFARFLLDEPDFSLVMRRHRIMRVECGGEYYIADVGVGAVTPEIPLRLVENEETEVRGVTYKLTRTDDPFLGWMVSFKMGGENREWKPLYAFTEDEQLEIDFVQPNFYCQYHAESIFNKENMIAIRTETGKCTLDGNVFKIVEIGKGTVEKREYGDSEIPGILEKHFGIRI